MEAQHSKIGASSMSRWSKCPGSVRLSEGIPKTTSSYAAEGTLAHEMAEKWLRSGSVSPPPDCGHEMAENIRVYVEFVREKSRGNGSPLFEHKFDLSHLHPGLFGTADAVIYNHREKILTVVDLKYGAGVPVEAAGNVQLQYYGLGAILSLKLLVKEIELTIVQPRCAHEDGSVRTWRFDAVKMLDFMADLLDAAKATEKDNAPLKSGAHCKFCPATGICPELKHQATELAQMEFSPAFSYNPEKLSEALEKLPLLETFIKGVREFAYNEAERGREIPGWKLVEKRATRKWIDEENAIKALAERTSLTSDKYLEENLKSVAQVEKILPKDQRAVLESLVEKVSSGKTLVPVTDKRPTTRDQAHVEFSEVEDGVLSQ